jgi:hypothetical protein
VRTSGPNCRYRRRDSREVNFWRRVSSRGESPSGCREESRVKSTSVGICSREEVREKRFGGRKVGSVLMRKIMATRKRMLRERETGAGTGRMGMPWTEGAARARR